MNTANNSSTSFGGIILLVFISFSTFFIFLISFEFYDNCKVLFYKNDIKKIKVKIDSSEVSSTRSGKSSSSSTTMNYYFNKGSIFQVSDNKGIMLKNENPTELINDYMQHHNDSLNLWILDKTPIKYANEYEKEIDVSMEKSNNMRIIIYFIIYIVSMLIIKLKF